MKKILLLFVFLFNIVPNFKNNSVSLGNFPTAFAQSMGEEDADIFFDDDGGHFDDNGGYYDGDGNYYSSDPACTICNTMWDLSDVTVVGQQQEPPVDPPAWYTDWPTDDENDGQWDQPQGEYDWNDTPPNTPAPPPAPCPTTTADLQALFPNADAATLEKLKDLLNKYSGTFGLDTAAKLQYFLGQTGAETGGFGKIGATENMNYSADRLSKVFGKYFASTDHPDRPDPNDYAHNPQMIANYVYANRMGNGPPSSNDGWNFRGRGIMQLTGRNNYTAFQNSFNNANSDSSDDIDVVSNPDLLSTDSDIAVLSAMWFFNENVLKKMTVDENASVSDVSKKVQGGSEGLQKRADITKAAKDVINCN